MKRQTTFFLVAMYYLVIKAAELILTHTTEMSPAPEPGWHAVVPYNSNYNSGLSPIFFLTIGLIYGSEISGKIPKPLFITHVILSIIPAIAMIGWTFFFENHNFDLEKLTIQMQASAALDLFFILSQATIIVILIVVQLKKQLRAKLPK